MTGVIPQVFQARYFSRMHIQKPEIHLYVSRQEHIWERFYRVKQTEIQSGSGIGLGLELYISRTIIERHGGVVGVQSKPGQGHCNLPSRPDDVGYELVWPQQGAHKAYLDEHLNEARSYKVRL